MRFFYTKTYGGFVTNSSSIETVSLQLGDDKKEIKTTKRTLIILFIKWTYQFTQNTQIDYFDQSNVWYTRDILDILIGCCLFLTSSTLVSRNLFFLRTEWTDWGNQFLPRWVVIPQSFIFWLILLYPNPSLLWRNVINWWITSCFFEYFWWYVRSFDWTSIVNSRCGIVPWRTTLPKTTLRWHGVLVLRVNINIF